MHELLLLSQPIPPPHHSNLLSILAGLTAMQPIPVLEKHLLFKPNRSPSSINAGRVVGGAQDVQAQKTSGGGGTGQGQQGGQELYFMKLVGECVASGEEQKTGKRRGEDAGDDDGEKGEKKEGEDVVMNGSDEKQNAEIEVSAQKFIGRKLLEYDNNIYIYLQHTTNLNPKPPSIDTTPPAPASSSAPGKWVLQFRDLPEVARQRPVTSRLIADTPITSGDPMAFMTALDYSYEKTYLLSGHRFTHHSTSLLLYRILVPNTPSTSTTAPSQPTTSIPSSSSTTTTVNLSETQSMDPGGSYILQATVRVQDGSKVETMNKGVTELVNLKETLKGCVDLEMGDRLAMDTRVR